MRSIRWLLRGWFKTFSSFVAHRWSSLRTANSQSAETALVTVILNSIQDPIISAQTRSEPETPVPYEGRILNRVQDDRLWDQVGGLCVQIGGLRIQAVLEAQVWAEQAPPLQTASPFTLSSRHPSSVAPRLCSA
jgi:hypothetical protein